MLKLQLFPICLIFFHFFFNFFPLGSGTQKPIDQQFEPFLGWVNSSDRADTLQCRGEPADFQLHHVQSLAEAAAKSQLDGVYLAPRNGVRQKIELVITSLLRKESCPPPQKKVPGDRDVNNNLTTKLIFCQNVFFDPTRLN